MEHNCEYELFIGLLFLRLHVALEYFKKKGKKEKINQVTIEANPSFCPYYLRGLFWLRHNLEKRKKRGEEEERRGKKIKVLRKKEEIGSEWTLEIRVPNLNRQ